MKRNMESYFSSRRSKNDNLQLSSTSRDQLGAQGRRIVTRSAGVPQSVFLMCFFVFAFFVHHQSIIASVADTQICISAIRTKIHRAASDMLLVACKWRYCCRFWALQGVRAVAFGCVGSSHVYGWLTLVEVFAVVPIGVSCFLSCWVGILCGPFERWALEGCFIAAFGYKRTLRHARTSRVLEVGSQWQVCKCS